MEAAHLGIKQGMFTQVIIQGKSKGCKGWFGEWVMKERPLGAGVRMEELAPGTGYGEKY